MSEEEMRQALFGSSNSAPTKSREKPSASTQQAVASHRVRQKSSAPRLQVKLRVAKVFEGEEEIFTYEASTLSTLVAEQEARKAAKRKHFKYFELISILAV
ncbi:hypothetical protein [Pseudomonas sp. PS01300]|uniref:hypothetical protein n=1 Tax=Pseudomonas sp. PS01300 TaxID=2991436 RepID=UPI00249BC1DD|nr:hypothetical protein [Pseudomonas sp. PS01300]